ncbi:hypothetical protein VTL71DRAFT_1611 [Oculimacula yallundae]|uniref:Secreted protein n=1 Tax=Oculimacula yallundae TaxID=86028 RepID=A0ABR4CCE2_9HELO
MPMAKYQLMQAILICSLYSPTNHESSTHPITPAIPFDSSTVSLCMQSQKTKHEFNENAGSAIFTSHNTNAKRNAVKDKNNIHNPAADARRM